MGCHVCGMKDTSIGRFSDLDVAWSWVVMFASFFVQFVIGGTNFTVGLVHIVLLERYSGSQAETAWAAALYTSISNFGGTVYFAKRYLKNPEVAQLYTFKLCIVTNLYKLPLFC